MGIRAKRLLPRPELDEAGNELDPRQDLINQLLLYKQFKEAAGEMKTLEENRALREVRGNISNEMMRIAQITEYADDLANLSMYHMMTAFEKVMNRFEKEQIKTHNTIEKYTTTKE